MLCCLKKILINLLSLHFSTKSEEDTIGIIPFFKKVLLLLANTISSVSMVGIISLISKEIQSFNNSEM
ncbi:hypothetical protein D3C85_1338700 [compost metagenome]